MISMFAINKDYSSSTYHLSLDYAPELRKLPKSLKSFKTLAILNIFQKSRDTPAVLSGVSLYKSYFQNYLVFLNYLR